MIPGKAAAWVATEMGSPIATDVLLTGGLTNTHHLLTLVDGRKVVLRRWTNSKPSNVIEFSAAREASVLATLSGSGCPVPDVLAHDFLAEACDVPALVLTWVDGKPPELDRLDALDVETLASTLAVVHAVVAPPELPAFSPWCWRHELGVPRGTSVRPQWRLLLHAVAAGIPAGPEVLLHGDFHPMNTLWSLGKLSAVLDWPSASRGHPLVDVARMAGFMNVISLGAGRRFADAYADSTGVHLTAWWEARDLLDRLPEHPDDELDLTMFDAYVDDVAARL